MSTMTLEGPTYLKTNIDDLVNHYRKLIRLVRKTMNQSNNISDVPGWNIKLPSQAELLSIRSIAVLESQPGQHFPYVLPKNSDVTIIIDTGEIELVNSDGNVEGRIGHGNKPFTMLKNWDGSFHATEYPTSLLLICYNREEIVDAGSTS